MKINIVKLFFKITVFTLNCAGAFVDKKPIGSLGSFFTKKVWPVFIISVWSPMFFAAFVMIGEFVSEEKWEEILESTQIIFLAILTLYMIFVVQATSRNFNNTMNIIETYFFSYDRITWADLYTLIPLWTTLPLAIVLYLGGCIYYKEVPVPLWVPFAKNETEKQMFVWFIEVLFMPFIAMNFGIWSPFVIVSTISICKELSYLVNSYVSFQSKSLEENRKTRSAGWKIKNPFIKCKRLPLNNMETSIFIGYMIERHVLIQRVIKNVSRIHSYLFLVQTVLNVIHSCVLAFNVYYTNRIERVLLKNFPILCLSYYVMFTYCWNGQQLYNKCEELYRAVYMCPWYELPLGFRTSLNIMMEVYKRPVYLTAAGLFPASYDTFLKCLQQSATYILLLNTLTSKKETA